MRSTIIIYRNASSCYHPRTASSYFCFFYSTTSSSTSTFPRNSRLQSLTCSTLKQQNREIQSFRRSSGSQRLYSTSRISSENQDQESKQSRSKTTTSILQIIAWLPVFLFFTSHVYSIGQVHGASMSPTLNPKSSIPGERLSSSIVCLDRWSARIAHYKVGDIVTLISPLHPAQLLTKRILALPGDVIRVPTPNSTSTSATSTGRQNFTRIKIPPGHAWVEGDSSLAERTGVGKSARSEADKSRDSREFGPVPLGLVTSRISFVLWPLSRFGFPLPRPTPNFKSSPTTQSYGSASQLDASSSDLLSKEVTKALDEAYSKVKMREHSSDDRSELIATSSSTDGSKSKKVRVPIIQEDDGEEEVYEVDSILSPYSRDENYVKGNSKSTSGGLGWGKKSKEEDSEREKAERRRERLNRWSRGGKLGE